MSDNTIKTEEQIPISTNIKACRLSQEQFDKIIETINSSIVCDSLSNDDLVVGILNERISEIYTKCIKCKHRSDNFPYAFQLMINKVLDLSSKLFIMQGYLYHKSFCLEDMRNHCVSTEENLDEIINYYNQKFEYFKDEEILLEVINNENHQNQYGLMQEACFKILLTTLVESNDNNINDDLIVLAKSIIDKHLYKAIYPSFSMSLTKLLYTKTYHVMGFCRNVLLLFLTEVSKLEI